MKTAVGLNTGQLELLVIIAKYRFVTIAAIMAYLGLASRTSLMKKLDILVQHGYLGMRYDSTYKRRGRPAAFYVTPQTLKLLKEQDKAKYVTDSVIKASYNDKKKATEQFIDDNLTIFNLAQALECSYPGIKVFSSRQLGGFGYFPQPLPDLYIVYGEGKDTIRYFLIKFASSKPIFTHTNRIKQLMAYAEEGTYDVSGNEFPTILAICDTTSIERLVQRTFRRAISQSSELIEVRTTSSKALSGLTKAGLRIWTDVDDTEELLAI